MTSSLRVRPESSRTLIEQSLMSHSQLVSLNWSRSTVQPRLAISVARNSSKARHCGVPVARIGPKLCSWRSQRFRVCTEGTAEGS